MAYEINLPNRITLARLALSVVFLVLLAQYDQRSPEFWMLDVAVGLFIVAASTDFLDGYIARKRGLVTPLGRVLDPFADKVLICGAFMMFIGSNFVDEAGHNVTEMKSWMVVIIVGRELLVTGLRGFSESRGINFSASLHGKLKMWMQSIAAPVILLLAAHQTTWASGQWATVTKQVLVWLTVIVTALSAVQYIVRARFILEESSST
ncbi:MAG: CDP-diacylglycerol--glycerol-3-phosphate 3-phosphatidyltransferase [Phycisphaerales bacterium]|nr:MAG: CDP-diacylglycerol--glycerol-3-phosphate 3-phosphatidyltransferase [Phycisphaerales bacterium]